MADLLLRKLCFFGIRIFLKRGVSLEFCVFKNIFERIKIMNMGYNVKLMISPLKK